jgi:hypothetical protein
MAKADIAVNDLGMQRNVLHLATAYGRADTIATLVQLGANFTARTDTLLHRAWRILAPK